MCKIYRNVQSLPFRVFRQLTEGPFNFIFVVVYPPETQESSLDYSANKMKTSLLEKYF